MSLVTVTNLSIRFVGAPLLEDAECRIEAGQRIGLLGRNGAGKTTLLRMLAGVVEPDHGTIEYAAGARVAFLQQDVPTDLSGSVQQVVRQGLGASRLSEPSATKKESTSASNQDSDWESEDWQDDLKVEKILSRMELDPHAAVDNMSSGMKRRVLLARALVDEPELLLLDEPTNHLDIDAIRWLEDFLSRWPGTLIFITHDRQFLRKLATRILEIEAGRIFDWSCDYDTFLKRKEQELAAEEKQNALFDKRLAEEERWIRQGIKARRTRNEGRVRRLQEMREQHSQRRAKLGTSQLQIDEGVKSGQLVIQAKHLIFAYPSSDDNAQPRRIVDDFSTTVMRGDKVGIIGRNGSGKTTLLKILLGQLEPQAGSVRLGTNLQIAYFDQLRDQLPEEHTVEHAVADGYQTVNVGGQSRHVLGYLQDFLFTPQRARTPIKLLSGGERNRVLLAKLFAKPANMIVLDEPTNDLDAETLEMLEERLVEYSGTLLVVSHDREFLNNVVTSSIVFEPVPGSDSNVGELQIREYVGGYDEWRRQYETELKRLSEKTKSGAATSTHKPKATGATGKSKGNATGANSGSSPTSHGNDAGPPAGEKPRKLSFKENRELEGLPVEIEQLEQQIATVHETLGDPEFYRKAGEEIAAKQQELKELEEQLQAKYHRWEELETRA